VDDVKSSVKGEPTTVTDYVVEQMRVNEPVAATEFVLPTPPEANRNDAPQAQGEAQPGE